MNLTLSVDEQVVARARTRAEAMGKSINQAVRDFLEQLAGTDDVEATLKELRRLSGHGNSGGRKWKREDAYERS